MEHIMKKLFLALLGIASVSLTAQAQSDSVAIHWQPDNSPILVGGAAPVYVEPVVNQQVIYSPPVQYAAPGPSAAQAQYSAPVQYNAPVQYYAPVVVNPPVYYPTSPCQPMPGYCCPARCAGYSCSTVQVIVFGEGQARQQGYSFGARR
jgi:hypothetical protein